MNSERGRSDSERSDRSDQSDQSDLSDESARIILPHGGYRRLRSFQIAQAVYDGTLVFCDRFVDRRSRTHDQMVQAARSGAQNIAEGSLASGTSKKSELKLTGIARASLGELLRDYEDFVRQHGLRLWSKDAPEALAVGRRRLCDSSGLSDRSDPLSLRTASAEAAANTLICLIHQATYLLRRQLQRLEQDFLEHGGVTERMYKARRERRSDQCDRSDQSDRSDSPPPPACPLCARPMVRRTARRGPRSGQGFWGCPAYPECTGTRP